MKCPICKKTIPDNAIKCPHCNSRVGIRCKKCNTVNPIQLKCSNCGEELLKLCPHCKSVNLPTAKKCRKCGKSLDTKPQKPVAGKIKLLSQKDAVSILTKGIASDDKKIFSISGCKGSGKSEVLKKTITQLSEEKIVWLFGKCTPLTQLTPGGFIQDVVLNMFNLPTLCINTPDFKKNAAKFFQNEFPEMNKKEISHLLNFLYPAHFAKFEEIQKNKKYTYEMLNKIFRKVSAMGRFVIIADNFDFIDGFSYEFISNLFKDELENLKLVMMYYEQKPAKSYLLSTDDKVYADIPLATLNGEEMQEFCKTLQEDFSYINENEKKEILEKSEGNPAFLEQALSLCFDCQFTGKNFVLPKSFEEIIKIRLQNLKEFNPIAYKTLLGASVIGDKINPVLIQEIFKFSDKELGDIFEYLTKAQFITKVNENFYELKSLLLWETILTGSKGDNEFININKQIANALKTLVINPTSVFEVIAQNIKDTQLAFDCWTNNTKLAAYTGDVNLYVISQKQCLAYINELEGKDNSKTRYNIHERLGKILTEYNPTEAMEFLPDAINNAKVTQNTVKEIELLGYLSNCCLRNKNYYGNIECVDNVLSKVGREKRLEIALLKSNKLEALLNIGNCGEVVNTIENDIMPVLDEVLSKRHKTPFTYDFLYDTWIKSYLMLAKALIMQGNDRSFEVLTILFDIVERDKIKDDDFICKCKLALAFANTMKGDFKTSVSVLENITTIYNSKPMQNENILEWNIIKILNKFFNKQYENLQEELFQVVTYANNCGDLFTKNVLKTLLGKIFKDNDQPKQATEIYNDQITYFAKEKMALGALLTWYLIAEVTLDTEGPHAAIDIAQQAIEVAQNPRLDNYFFIVLLKIVMIKACIMISDYERAKIILDSAITQASKFNMQDVLSRLYMLYGKYFQEIGLVKTPQQEQYLVAAKQMHGKVSEILKLTKNDSVNKENEKAKTVLLSFCELNDIKI